MSQIDTDLGDGRQLTILGYKMAVRITDKLNYYEVSKKYVPTSILCIDIIEAVQELTNTKLIEEV